MARQKVQVVLSSLCVEHGGEEEYPQGWVGELTEKTSDQGSCSEVEFPIPFYGRHIEKDGKIGKRKCLTDGNKRMFIPVWLLTPFTTTMY